MRIPHYLTRSPSGAYTFRLLVPRRLRDTLGRRVIKRSLYTTDLVVAQVGALSLYAQCKRLFRGHAVADKTLDELLASAQRGRQEFKAEIRPDGSVSVETDGTQADSDNLAAHLPLLLQLNAAARAAVPVAPSPPNTTPVAKTLTLGKAKDLWLAAIAPTTIPKTLTIKRSAIAQFTAYIGAARELPTIERPDLAGFFQHLRDGNISTPTIVNKSSYLKHFFEWCAAAGYYPAGTSPTVGQVSYGTREKRQRRKLGFKAFSVEQVRHLLDPNNFATLPFSSRWAVVIGLYTGARASEVGQLLLKDIATVDGVLCINITDDGEHQRLKSDVSRRVVPVHPELLALGFAEYIAAVKEQGAARVFPKARDGVNNGAGNWITKAFGRYLGEQTKGWDAGKRGFHSLRKTFIQEMQGAGVASEMRAQIVGHELDDEHHGTYSRDFTPAEKLNGVKSKGRWKTAGMNAVTYGLNIDGLRALLSPPKPKAR
ncbi:DUF6538 domain-containing protein [Stenotrophomonas acidaminiphila]|uniref:DUF6538 domain-containing protein n=1 Tax=Stenotrophomonas acidaminiphila TaxID=128780 RepID=UPI0028A9C53B|nr:DUF6538 domain-containing protein [Stenotrophomonas acidaminiphila]